MTDDAPVPPWLEVTNAGLQGPPTYALARNMQRIKANADEHFENLPFWLRWRSELAAALGLGEPESVAKTVAAELRAQADALDYEGGADESEGIGTAQRRLRARADELDPKEKP